MNSIDETITDERSLEENRDVFELAKDAREAYLLKHVKRAAERGASIDARVKLDRTKKGREYLLRVHINYDPTHTGSLNYLQRELTKPVVIQTRDEKYTFPIKFSYHPVQDNWKQ